MKNTLLNRNVLFASILYGVMGGIFLIGKIVVRGPWDDSIFPILFGYTYMFSAWFFIFHIMGIPMIIALMIYKRKSNNNMNYWRSFFIALSVFYTIYIAMSAYILLMRYLNDSYIIPIGFLILNSLRFLAIGIASGLTAALLFRNKIAALLIVALAIIVIILGRRMEIW